MSFEKILIVEDDVVVRNLLQSIFLRHKLPVSLADSLAQAQAHLAQSQAQLEYLRGQEERYQELLAQNFVSREGYAQVASNFHSAEAGVNAASAAVESARVNLAYTTIRSPIGGRAGKVLLSEGNLVKGNDTVALVVINGVHTTDKDTVLNDGDVVKLMAVIGGG